MRYDLIASERAALKDGYPGLVPISITPEQVRALYHASQSPAFYVAGLLLVDDAQLDQAQTMNRTLLIEAYDDEGWIVVNYAWNTEGQGTWLAPDGGWHYGPGESGYYPWKEDDAPTPD